MTLASPRSLALVVAETVTVGEQAVAPLTRDGELREDGAVSAARDDDRPAPGRELAAERIAA